MLTRRRFTQFLLCSLGLGVSTCSQPLTQEEGVQPLDAASADLVIWWEQGYLLEENEGIIGLVQDFQRRTGLSVSLKLMPVDLIQQELLTNVADPEHHPVPDIVYSLGVDTHLAPQLAWRDQLTDLSSLVDSMKSLYSPGVLPQVAYHNQTLGQRRYYALPLWQSSDYLHAWTTELTPLGRTDQDIPQDWRGFWEFWQTAQDEWRQRGDRDCYGVGLCMSTSGFDTYTSFLMFLDAYGIRLLDDAGVLMLSEREQQRAFVDALADYTQLYLKGYVPPDALEWSGSGNNVSFLESRVLMTHNLTLSIPLTQKLQPNVYNQDALERYLQIVTLEPPRRLNGEPLHPRRGIKQAILPKAGRHQAEALKFMEYLGQPENTYRLLQVFKGRLLPVMPQLLSRDPWHDPTDPHLAMALKLYDRPTLLPYEVLHPSFSQVQSDQIWATTIQQVIRDHQSPAEAASWAIAAMQRTWSAWENSA